MDRSSSLVRRRRWTVASWALGFGVAALLASGNVAAAADERTNPGATDEHDPFEGVDPDGRIPTIGRPDDFLNPDRWRYIPEGRIKPGNLLQRFLVTSFVAPFFFQDEDVGTGFGVAVTDIDFRKQRRREFAGLFLSYTTEGQQNYSVVWQRWLHHVDVPGGGGVFQEERSLIRGRAQYSKALTLRFFGFGPRTPEVAETSYTDEKVLVELGLEHSWPRPGDDLVLTGGLRFEFHDLSSGELGGAPSTEQSFPALVSRGDDQALGYAYWGIRWDTRDSQANPYGGWAIGARIDAALLQSSGDVGARYTAFATKVFEIPGLLHAGGSAHEEHPATDTLAFSLRTQFTSGNLPFYALPALGGGDELRGFIAGRFRDRASWFGSVEYRIWVLERGFGIPFTRALRIERVGIAPFYDVGTVDSRGSDFFDSKTTRVHHSYGIGLRATLERQAIFRIDLGFSSEESATVHAGFGLPF